MNKTFTHGTTYNLELLLLLLWTKKQVRNNHVASTNKTSVGKLKKNQSEKEIGSLWRIIIIITLAQLNFTHSFRNPLRTRLVDVPVKVPVPPMLAE